MASVEMLRDRQRVKIAAYYQRITINNVIFIGLQIHMCLSPNACTKMSLSSCLEKISYLLFRRKYVTPIVKMTVVTITITGTVTYTATTDDTPGKRTGWLNSDKTEQRSP